MKGESQIRHSSSETQGSLAWEKKRSGWLGEYPRALHPTWQVEGEGRKLRPLLTTCGQLIRTKAALSPDGVTPPRPRGQGCQVTGIGVFSVPAASCPGKPDSQLGHLSGMDCRRAHRWGHPESNGPEQSPCQPLRSHQLPPLFAGVRFFAKWISSHIYRYNILWTLGFNNLICFSCISQLSTVNETFTECSGRLWNGVPDSPQSSARSNYNGVEDLRFRLEPEALFRRGVWGVKGIRVYTLVDVLSMLARGFYEIIQIPVGATVTGDSWQRGRWWLSHSDGFTSPSSWILMCKMGAGETDQKDRAPLPITAPHPASSVTELGGARPSARGRAPGWVWASPFPPMNEWDLIHVWGLWLICVMVGTNYCQL